jgi:hypothetical protein
MAANTTSQYEKFWLMLLADGKLKVHVPTSMVASIKKAIIKRKYEHRMRTGIRFNPLKIAISSAIDKQGRKIPDKTQLEFFMHNLTEKDI